MHAGFVGTVMGLAIAAAAFYMLLHNATHAREVAGGATGAFKNIAKANRGQ